MGVFTVVFARTGAVFERRNGDPSKKKRTGGVQKFGRCAHSG